MHHSSEAVRAITRDLNAQQRAKRAQVAGSIVAFSQRYDAVDASEESELYEEDTEAKEQQAILEDRVTLEEAVEKLKELERQLQHECKAMQSKLKVHKKAMTR
jgi:hypothetical protein